MAAKIQNLIDECKAKGIKVSMRDIARELGVHYSTIVKIKRGEIANPRIEILQSICAYFSEKLGRRVTLDELVDPVNSRASEILRERRAIENARGGFYDRLEELKRQVAWMRAYVDEVLGKDADPGEVATLMLALEHASGRLSEIAVKAEEMEHEGSGGKTGGEGTG